MAKKRVKRTIWFLLTVAILSNSFAAPVTALPQLGSDSVQQIRALLPLSRAMVDQAIDALSGGLAAMTPAQRSLFDQLYDPGNTGDIDQEFVAAVLANYRRIRSHLDRPWAVVRVSESSHCQDQRLYYTDLTSLYVCPYFDIEESLDRQARGLIHEAVHISLLVVDRPYFHKNTYSTRYRALTPRGAWPARLPLVGPLFRELAHHDTLFHPDAYAWFAVEVAALATTAL